MVWWWVVVVYLLRFYWVPQTRSSTDLETSSRYNQKAVGRKHITVAEIHTGTHRIGNRRPALLDADANDRLPIWARSPRTEVSERSSWPWPARPHIRRQPASQRSRTRSGGTLLIEVVFYCVEVVRTHPGARIWEDYHATRSEGDWTRWLAGPGHRPNRQLRP